MDARTATKQARQTAFTVLFAISFCHMLNDTMQALLPALYPALKDDFALDFGDIGLITLAFQATASVLQPLVGFYADKHPMPYSLTLSACFTMAGLVLLSWAASFGAVLIAAMLIGIGSSVFHPESSRVARAASGGRHGFAQSLFQVGGSTGSAIGPLLAAFVVMSLGRGSVAWFSLIALVSLVVLWRVGAWYAARLKTMHAAAARARAGASLPRALVVRSLAILLLLIVSKYFYLTSISTYYTLYLIDRFAVSVPQAQVCLFVFLGAAAAGTLIGGAIGDRWGRKFVIWVSILGALPFTLAMPYLDLTWTIVFSGLIGFILSSAFSAIVVYGQDLLPGRVGTVAGIFFGVAFGIAGLGGAALGELADLTSIVFVYHVCAWLPALGLFGLLLPNLDYLGVPAEAAAAEVTSPPS